MMGSSSAQKQGPARKRGFRAIAFLGPCLLLAFALLIFLARSPKRAEAPHSQSTAEERRLLASSLAVVDGALEQAWAAAGLQTTPRADTLTIARRLSLSLTGTVPSLEEIQRIEAQKPGTGAEWWLEQLLADRRFSGYLAERLARAYVGVEDGPFLIYRRRRMVDWLAEQIQKNRPYDELVRQIINSQGIWTTQPEVNFVTVTVDQNDKEKGPDEVKLAGRVSRAFLGVHLNCVQCHDDLLGDRWKQADFHQMAAFFAPAEMSLTGVRDNPKLDYKVRYHRAKQDQLVAPAAPFQPELLPSEGSLRSRLAVWVTHPKNKAFARTAVNRVWALMFNRPMVEPVDDIPLEGPFPPGMEDLADDFVAHHHDLRRLIRVIAATRAFQLSGSSQDAGSPVTEAQEKAFAAFPLTRLRPEQVAGSVIQASSLHTIDAKSHVLFRVIRFFQQGDFIKRYGDAGEDEFAQRGGTIPQRLVLMNGQLVADRSGENLAMNASTRLAALAPEDKSAVETAYLCALTRRPTPAENRYFVARLASAKGKTRQQVMEDLCWTLINSTEFSWNH